MRQQRRYTGVGIPLILYEPGESRQNEPLVRSPLQEMAHLYGMTYTLPCNQRLRTLPLQPGCTNEARPSSKGLPDGDQALSAPKDVSCNHTCSSLATHRSALLPHKPGWAKHGSIHKGIMLRAATSTHHGPGSWFPPKELPTPRRASPPFSETL